MNQLNCHEVSQSKGRITIQSTTKEHYNQNGLQGISQLKVQPETTEFEMTASEYHSKTMSKNGCQGIKNHYINLDVSFIPYCSITLLCISHKGAGYGPRGPGFETWPGRRSFWP